MAAGTRESRIQLNLALLTAQEREMLQKYEGDPTGIHFLPFADILRKYGRNDEAIVVLEEGLRKYPNFHSARASLGRSLFYKGMFEAAKEQLDTVAQKSPDNLMAQRLRLKLCLALGLRDETKEALDHLKRIFPDDDFTRSVRESAALNDWRAAEEIVARELEKLGIAQLQIHAEPSAAPANPDAFFSTFQDSTRVPIVDTADMKGGLSFKDSSWQVPPEAPTYVDPSLQRDMARAEPLERVDQSALPAALRTGEGLSHIRGDSDRYLLLKGYRRIQPQQVLGDAGEGRRGAAGESGLESTTLAEIYAAQGLYIKACDIYERVLRENPADREKAARLAEIQSMARDQLQNRSADSQRRVSAQRDLDEQGRKLRWLELMLERLEARGAERGSEA